MLRPFFYNARTWGPTQARNINFLVKPDHLDGMTVWHYVCGDIFDERRAAPPAYGRRAWSKIVSYLMVFRYVFRYWSDCRHRLKKTVQKYKKLVKTMLWQLRNSFFPFKALQHVDVERCSKNVFWIDCFRWPEGPSETIQYACRNEKTIRNTQLRSNDAWLG